MQVRTVAEHRLTHSYRKQVNAAKVQMFTLLCVFSAVGGENHHSLEAIRNNLQKYMVNDSVILG